MLCARDFEPPVWYCNGGGGWRNEGYACVWPTVLHGDANFNVTALVREVSGHWGVAERYVYDPYGHVTVLNGGKEEVEPDTWVYFDADGDVTEWAEDAGGSDWANTILFAGYRRDAETGLYHVRHRMYDVRLGLWLTRDPEGYVDGMSLYAYVGCGPATEAPSWRVLR